jgi:glycosyltransferase involved in cell wall biosynthesis
MQPSNPKHILFIVENQSVPDDRRVWAEAKALFRAGLAVSIICPQSKRRRRRYENISGIDIHRHLPAPEGSGKLSFIREYLSAVFWELVLCTKIFLKKPFHVIHGANPPDHIFLIALIFRFFGVKYIFDHHDLAPELYRVRFKAGKDIFFRVLMLLEKCSCKIADAVISTNASYKTIIAERHKVPPDKIYIVRNDPEKNMIEKIHQISAKPNGNKKILLYLGSINPQDGVDELLRALDYLVNELKEKDYECKIIGDGSALQDMRRMAAEMNLLQYVDFKGFIGDKNRLHKYLAQADICVESAPANILNQHSTFIKILEYMAAAKPIVAFDLKETRYSAGDTAILVEPGNTAAFAHAIYTLIHDPGLRKEIGRAGCTRIRRFLNWDRATANLLKAYESLEIHGNSSEQKHSTGADDKSPRTSPDSNATALEAVVSRIKGRSAQEKALAKWNCSPDVQ